MVGNFAGELRLATLARQFGMTPSVFSRFFARNVGNSFTDTVLGLRVGFACKLLADTDRPVTAICYEAGYTNVSNFNRLFVRARGITPSAYRRMSRQRSAHQGGSAVIAHDALVPSATPRRPFAAPQHA